VTKPDPGTPADHILLLRQQLILAQVRIMELEDARDSLTPRLQELEQLLGQAQTLADQKLNEAAHLAKVLADCQARAAQLQEMHDRAAADLAASRAAVAAAEARLTERVATIARLETGLKQAETELQALRSSRSWRWTAWLRSLGGKP
jgi:chromosome segregation ATPase